MTSTMASTSAAAALSCAIALIVSGVSAGPTAPYRLRMEYMNNPMGVDVQYKPRLTWALGHTERGQGQSSYRLAVSKFVGSGWVSVHDATTTSNVSQNVPLEAELTPDTLYTWTVMYVDKSGAPSPWAANATFSTGVGNWSAKWIGQNTSGSFQAGKQFQTANGKQIARATFYVVGLGYYKLYVNGKKISTHELGAFTTYTKRVYYDTYDATDAMRENLQTTQGVGVTVGNGWYSQSSVHVGNPTLLLQASILYTDGSTDTFSTDTTWTVTASPVTSSDIYKGEDYNASMETPGWTSPGYKFDNNWAPATVMQPPSATVQITSHAILPPIRIAESYTPCDMWESSPGVFVFDFCQNMAGITTLRVPEGLATVSGAAITMQHAELIYGPKPAAIHNHYGNAPEINTYYTRGDGAAIEHTAMFVYAGFRYVSLTGFPGTPDFKTITAHFIHTDYELTGSISFSDPLLTSVQHITRAAAMSNFQSIPTDCPQRERRGWLGDAQLSCETNMHNFDMGAPYTSFIQQIGDSQDPSGTVQDCVPFYGHGKDPADPAWGGAFALIANWVGKYYHDDQIFAEHYDQIKAHTDNLVTTAQADKADGLLTYGGWGDWCPPSGCHACWDRQAGMESQNSVMVSSFYYILELRIMAEYAGILGKTSDQQKYTDLATEAASAYQKHFYNATGKTYDETRVCGEYLSPQTKISLAATLGIIPSEDYDAVMDTLVEDIANQDWHLNVGIVGVKYLLPTLSAAGRGDVALMIAQARTPPSYIYMVEQGATTLWETWTGTQYIPSASRNHIMFGSNSDWYFKYLAGLTMSSDSRGWQQLSLRPEVWNNKRGVSVCANLSSTQASIDTPRGLLSGSWNCLQGNNTGTCGVFQEHDTVKLDCGTESTIKSVDYASFGTPTGSCNNGFTDGNCSSTVSKAVVEKLCVGKSSCTFDATTQTFGGDPCFDVTKRLAVKVSCTEPSHSGLPVFEYSVVVPTGSIATVSLPQFGSKMATVAEANGVVWKSGAYVPGVAGVTGASVDALESVVVSVGSGSYTFTVFA